MIKTDLVWIRFNVYLYSITIFCGYRVWFSWKKLYRENDFYKSCNVWRDKPATEPGLDLES